MYLNLLSDSLSWGDRLNYMGIGVLLGMVVVFAVLILLWLILEIFGKIAGRGKSDKSAEKPAVPVPAPKAEPAPVAAPVPAVQAVPTGDDAVVAAITAALAVYLEAQGPKAPSINGFRVVSFKKVGTAAHWNQN
ncbi:MAG: OadG family protein [Clostridia bacterium]|nr:OadG family protein [Clostridia bacterium]